MIKRSNIMSEEEIIQNENESNKFSTVGYDICGLIFCIYPIFTAIFGIDYHNADEILHTALKMLAYCALPFAIAKIGLNKKNIGRTLSPVLFSVVFVLIVIFAVILLIGFADGGKLF